MTKTAETTFNASTERWFDKLVNYATTSRDPAIEHILAIVAHRYPVKRSVEALRLQVTKIANVSIRSSILATIDALRRFGHDNEFKFTYHTYPRYTTGGFLQCSAAGELFSQLKQAIEYNR